MYYNTACLTIVSKNYFSFARVLSKSFLENHPGSTFYVLLVDELDDYFVPSEEQFELFTINDINLPGADIFPFQYTILELNTAVKPYAIKYLFDKFQHDKITYIDPDIKIYRPLEDVWSALEKFSIVLTPHMREPFDDDRHPTELNIIQSGTYNLGFIGLSRTNNTFKLLDWWMEKLYLNCKVDIASGLFTDQKWIDLVPAYFNDVFILRDPSYNVAYWNLHEREVEKIDDSYFIDGNPLKFFHFSGYNPNMQSSLSKHQDRHDIMDYPDLKSLCDSYKDDLLKADYENIIEWPYAYKFLSNGVEVIYPMHEIIRHCLELHIPFPSLRTDPDKFCQFLLTPNPKVFGKKIPPLYYALLNLRPDVKSAYPAALTDSNDPGFDHWIRHSGIKEYPIYTLIKKFGHYARYKNSIRYIGEIYSTRNDLKEAIPDAWKNNSGIRKYIDWLKMSGLREYKDLSSDDINIFEKNIHGVYKILSLYCIRTDLHSIFYNIFNIDGLERFYQWGCENLPYIQNVTENELEMFYAWCKFNFEVCLKFILIYNTHVREVIGGMPTIFRAHAIIRFCNENNVNISNDDIYYWLTSEYLTDIYDHYCFYYASDLNSQRKHPDILDNAKKLTSVVRKKILMWAIKEWRLPTWFNKTITEKELTRRKTSINVAGFYDANTGMGESFRSMLRILYSLPCQINKYHLPSIYHNNGDFELPESGAIFGLPSPFATNNIFVANADSTTVVMNLFPSYIFQIGLRKRIGYWVWETDELPGRWTYLKKFYDEIWTPSSYAAESIRKTVDLPVRVVPHALDKIEFDELNKNREYFSLPEDSFIFGYFFDLKSILERKNPKAVIDAFIHAFPKEHDRNNEVHLLLKVNSALPGNYQYEKLKNYINDERIIWFEDELSRHDTLQLMKCLDAYVSLHRSEGFGLTIAEAATIGLPVIATNYSGNTDFMDIDSIYPVQAMEIPINKNYGPYLKGAKWGQPDITDAVKKMQYVRNNHQHSIEKDEYPKIYDKIGIRPVSQIVRELLKINF